MEGYVWQRACHRYTSSFSRMDVWNWKKVLEFKVHCWKLMKRQPVFPFLRKIPSEAFVAYSQKIG